MNLVSMARGPLTALVLVACSSSDTTNVSLEVGPRPAQTSAEVPRESRLEASQLRAEISCDALACGADSDAGGDVTDVDAAAGEAPDAGAPVPDGSTDPVCGDGVLDPAEQCDLGAANGGPECDAVCALPPLGSCLSCAQANCPIQYANAIGSASDAANLADITVLFDCVIGGDWALGHAIPQGSCFFADPAQPLGSLVPCYCGDTPQPQCLSSGPLDSEEACGREVELASHCDPITASCVTGSGSNPALPLGDALQLLNCERAACPVECGFPSPIEE